MLRVSVENESAEERLRILLIRKDYLLQMFTNYLLKSSIPYLFFRVITNETSHLHDLSKKFLHQWKFFM